MKLSSHSAQEYIQTKLINNAKDQMIGTAKSINEIAYDLGFAGGLNFQIEHHLFTRVCHVHYRKLAPLVASVTKAFGFTISSGTYFFRCTFETCKNA